MAENAVLLQVIGSLLGSGVLAAGIAAYFNRKKLGAEATDIITKAATGVLERVEADNAILRARAEADHQKIGRMNARVTTLETSERRREWELHQLREQLQVHAAWDYIAIEKIKDCGIDIDTAPALMPEWVKRRPTPEYGGFND